MARRTRTKTVDITLNLEDAFFIANHLEAYGKHLRQEAIHSNTALNIENAKNLEQLADEIRQLATEAK